MLSGAPVPRGVSARWFSFREQAFYELDIELPEDLEERVAEWKSTYPDSEGYMHYLDTGYSGDGRARVWWRVSCPRRMTCDGEQGGGYSFPIVREAQAEEIDGDPGRYTRRTAELRDEGRIPADVQVPE